MSNLYKLYAPLGSEFSCPDTEMFPLKTTENHCLLACDLGYGNAVHRPCHGPFALG